MNPVAIDITDLTNKLAESFVLWATSYIYIGAISIPWLSWLSLPLISTITQTVIKLGASHLAKSTVMQAQFKNTALSQAGKAESYVRKVLTRKDLVRNGATREQIAKAEKDEINDFYQLVRIS